VARTAATPTGPCCSSIREGRGGRRLTLFRSSSEGVSRSPERALQSVAQLGELAGSVDSTPGPLPDLGRLPLGARSPTSRRRPRRVARPGVLLDRDGTIIVDHGYVGSTDRVELIDGAAESIAALNRAGVPVAVVSNQSGVARGLFGVQDVEDVHRHIASLLAVHGARIDRFFYCPFHPEGTVAEFARFSNDRKPNPGMARAAAVALNLDLTRSWVVGDRPEDIGLAEAVGAAAIHIGPDRDDHPNVQSFATLAEATTFILGRISP
jgi:histidinol-phosphate phosphatase family protein